MRQFISSLVILACAAAAFGAEAPTVSPEGALALLKEGNQRFQAGSLRHPRQDAKRRAETAKGQNPYASILGCSDSRESLDAIFDAGIGDLFTIRVAGNVADTDEIASLEYGAEHLGVPLIVVLGHTSCGAVTAVVKKSELAGQLPALLDNIKGPAARTLARFGSTAPDLIDRTASENVLQSIHDLLTRSKILSSLVEEGKLRIIGGLYHLDSGAIDWVESVANEQTLVAAGLAGPKNNAPLVSAVSAAGFGALLLLVQLLIVSPRRRIAGLKFHARLLVSFAAIIVVVAGGAAVSLATSDLLPLAVTCTLALVFGIVYARSHHRGFREFYLAQKENWAAANVIQ